MRKKCFALICAVSMACLGLCACGEVPSFLGAEEEAAPAPIVMKEVHIPMEKVSTLNPAASTEEDSYYISKLVYEGLFALDESLAAKPVLAKSWEFQPEKKTLTLSLVQGVTWHDGEAFTAADVKFSIEVYLYFAGKGVTLYDSNVAGIRSVKATDDHTVVITYSSTGNLALENLIFPILPQHQFRRVSGAGEANPGFVPVGTGPYRVAEVDMSSQVKLAGYEGYRGAKPENTLLFQILPDKENAVNLFNIYEYDMAIVKDINREALLSNKEADTVSFLSNEAEVLGFNTKNPQLQDARVRQAVALSVDTERIIEICYYNSGKQSDTLYYPDYLGVESQQDAYPYEPTMAKDLLKTAGLIDLNADGYLENIQGKPFQLEILVNEGNSFRAATAELVKEGLLSAGIQSTVLVLPYEAYRAALATGEYDIFLGGYRFEETYDLRSLLHSSAKPVTGYSNPQMDQALDRLQASIISEERVESFLSIRELLIKELPYYCILYKTYGLVTSPAFRGEKEALFFNPYMMAQGWTCERPAVQ